MNRRHAFLFGLFLVGWSLALLPNTTHPEEALEEKCSSLLDRDTAYSALKVQEDQDQGPRFAVPGGPIDLLMAKIFAKLDVGFVDRLGTGFIIEFITQCRNSPVSAVSSAIATTQENLRLDPASTSWGIKDIDTDGLLNGTCDAFAVYVQEHGIGEMYYNDPVRVTFDAYWAKFDLSENEFEKSSSVESDAQFACSLEPENKFIDVLDALAADYELQRIR